MKKIGALSNRRGFTLIELMVVVAIIGILAAVAIPKFAEMLRKSKEGSTKGALTGLKSALHIYIGENEGWAPCSWGIANSDLLKSAFVPKYVDQIPTAKLGSYHMDSTGIRVVNGTERSSDLYTNDANGWVFTSVFGGEWWVNCTHTDAKNVNITSW